MAAAPRLVDAMRADAQEERVPPHRLAGAPFRVFDDLRAVRESKLGPQEKAVRMCLTLRADEAGHAWPALETIAADTSLSRATVSRCIATLREGGWIRTWRRSRTSSTTYTMLVPSAQPETSQAATSHGATTQEEDSRVLSVSTASAQPETRSTHVSLHGTTHDVPAAPAAPTKPRRAKHSPEDIAAKALVLEAFVEAFKAAKGCEPSLDHEGDHAAAFKLVARFGAEEACGIVRRAMTDPWVANNAPTLRHIASRPDAWRGREVLNTRGKSPWKQPDSDGWREGGG